MLGVVANVSASETQGALAILQTVSSDERYKARLQELIDAAEQANAELKNLEAAKANAEQRLAAAEVLRKTIEADANSMLDYAKKAKGEADVRLADLAAREAAHSKAVVDYEASKQQDSVDLKARNDALQRTHSGESQALQARNAKYEAAVAAIRDKLSELAAQYEQQQAYLQTMLKSLG